VASAARLTVLGSGTAVPLAGRATSCYLLDDGAGTRVLVDLGPGALQRAAQAGCPLPELSAVLLTHAHPDHCADLAALQFALRSPSLPPRGRPLPVSGHPGVLLVALRLRNAWPGWLAPPPSALELRVAAPGPLPPLGGLSLRAFRVAHHETSLGYRVTLPDGFVLAFPGDVIEGGELPELGRQADLLVLEAAGSERQPIPGHLTPRRAGAVAAACGARHVLLTHFYPEVLADPIEEQVRETFEGRLTLAQDGLSLPLGR
jgi:ribonuclease BN (tRNA processing enzyme)